MSKITLTSPSDDSYGGITITEGDLARLVITRDDPSLAQAFEIRFRNINGDQSTAFVGLDLSKPITVSFAAGDASPRVLDFQTADNAVHEIGQTVNFDVVPLYGASAADFTILSQPADPLFSDFQIRIADNDPPNVRVYTSHWELPTPPMVGMMEGQTITFVFERVGDDRQETSFAVLPEEGYENLAERFFGYDLANPIVVRFNAYSRDIQTFSLHAVHDHQDVWSGPIRFKFGPITGVTGMTFDAITGANNEPDGGLSFAISIGNIDIHDTAPVWRFYNPHSGTHFYTATAAERDNWQAAGATFEGVAMRSLTFDTPDAVYVHRFSNAETGRYFWTANQEEAEAWKANGGTTWTYEGGAYAATLRDGKGLTEVYRFREEATGHYAWTANQAEKDNWLDTAHGWVLEGVAYYVAAEDPLIA